MPLFEQIHPAASAFQWCSALGNKLGIKVELEHVNTVADGLTGHIPISWSR